MKKSLFAILFLSTVLAAGSYMLLNSRRMQLFGTLVARVETTQKRVALTFDDAPTPQTLRVLALLKQYRIPATFYAVGSQLERYPEIARSIVADGHELGNHSYSHHTQPGSIILLHPFCNDGCEPARAALPLIIEGLQAKGYHFVTVSELMAEAGH